MTDNLIIFQIAKEYDIQSMSIQRDIEKFREQNEVFKQKLQKLFNANDGGEQCAESSDSLIPYIQFTDEIFNNFRNQLQLLSQEKDSYENLWREACSMTKRQHEDEITRLREENNKLKINGATQVNLNQQSVDEMRMLTQKNEQLEQNAEAAQRKLDETEGRLYQTELSLDESKKLNKYQMEKLTDTLERLQSTIKIAEEAFAEIQLLRQEKQQIEDESKDLACTIGSVFETASMKIHQEVEEMRGRHRMETEKSSVEIEGLKRLVEIEREGRSDALRQTKLLEQKLSSIELEPLATTIASLEKAFSEIRMSMATERNSTDKVVNEISKLRNFLKHHEKYKEQWKHVVRELLENLSDKIIRLLVENYKLKQKHHHHASGR